MKKQLYLLVGPSGSGKTSIGEELKKQGLVETVSCTTRDKRVGEVEGLSYYFIDKKTFDNIDKVEETEYAGNYYCLSRKELETKWETSDKLYCIVDRVGAEHIIESLGKDIVKVIYIYIPLEVMEKRMKDRGDSEENINKRLDYCKNNGELNNHDLADLVVENVLDLQSSVDAILQYINK